MKKTVLFFVFLLVMLVGVGCVNESNEGTSLLESGNSSEAPSDKETEVQPPNGGLTGEQPPNVGIKIGEEVYETKLGTFCWSSLNQSRCADSVGPVELLKNKKPITVQPRAEIEFIMDYEPLPNKFHVEQITEGKHTEVMVKENIFQAPAEKGVYYYSYGVWWMDVKKSNVAHGDASYYFVLEVL